MAQGALQLPASGGGILGALRLVTACGLAGAKGVVARIVSCHLKIEKALQKKRETLLAL